MNIKAEIEKLTSEKQDLENVISASKERIKEINLKCRQLSTILKHAESVMNGQAEPEPAEHPEA